MFLSAARKKPVKKANLSLRYRRVSEKGNLLCPFFEDFFTQEYTRYTAKQSVCVKYAGAVKQKVWNEAENRERDWGKTRPTRPKGEAGALLRHALPISLLIFA